MEIIFCKREVYIHEKANDVANSSDFVKIGGQLQIIKNKNGTFIRFTSYYDSANLDEWTDIDPLSPLATMSFKNNDSDSVQLENANKYFNRLQFNINDLNSIRRTYPGVGTASLTFILADGSTWPPLHFHKGGSKEFLNELKKFFLFKKDSNDARLFIVQKPNEKAFEKSLYELSLFEEQKNDVVKKFLNQPIDTTLLGFSKVKNMFFDAINPQDQQPRGQNVPTSLANINYRGQFSDDGISNLLDSINHENIHTTKDEGFEVVTRVDLGPMPHIERDKPVEMKDIEFDKYGRLVETEALRRRIFRGSLDPGARQTIWKYLLNCHQWDSTEKMRIEARKTKVDLYYQMKLQWKSFTQDQKQRCSIMKERENLIDKDVMRTDRNHPCFAGEDNENSKAMHDILMTYNMYNFDLGYVQGMSDLLAPLMVVFENEVDSFWGFVGFMNKVESNFHMDQLHIKQQLANLQTLLEFIDSKFSDYLNKNDSSNMYFCFRWILILFKREFTFPDIMKLWEILWTDYPCKNFHLLLCISILLLKKNEIIANNFGFNEILKFVNDMSFQIDLEKTLETAEGLFLQLSTFKNLPNDIAEILNLPTTNTNNIDDC